MKGWLSAGLQETWDTLDHLVDNGCEYVADWCNDDQPYQMTLDDGRTIVVDALHPAAQRQVGDRAALRLGRRLPADDLRPVRRALQGGREVRPRHGDRAAPVSDRRAAPHRRPRCGVKVHLQAQEGLEGYRLGNCASTISRNWMAACSRSHRNARERRVAEQQEHGDEDVSRRRGGAADRRRFAGAPAARAADTVSVGTVGSASANLWPVYIGIKKGFFDAANIKVDIIYVQSSATLVQQLAAGSLDITMSTGLVDPIRAIDRRRADLDRPLRGAGAALRAGRQAGDQEARGPQGQGDLARRAEGHHPHLSSSGCWRRTASSPASSTWCLPARPRRVLSALLAGAVDAAILLPPFNFQAEAQGFTNLGLTVDYAPELPFSGTRGQQGLGRRSTRICSSGARRAYQERRVVL